MIAFYNDSVSTDADVKTIKMDITLNWNTSTVNAYVNGEFRGSANFFQTASSVDKLRLYNLYQSTSYWKHLVVCAQNCYSFNNQWHLAGSLTLLGLLLMILISFWFFVFSIEKFL